MSLEASFREYVNAVEAFIDCKRLQVLDKGFWRDYRGDSIPNFYAYDGFRVAAKTKYKVVNTGLAQPEFSVISEPYWSKTEKDPKFIGWIPYSMFEF